MNRNGFDDENGAFFDIKGWKVSVKLPPLFVEVPCSLEQINGCVTRKIKVRRNINGREKEIILNIELKPRWKNWTKVAFNGEGDQKQGSFPQDFQFIMRKSPHGIYHRQGDNLICNVNISLKRALFGFIISKPGIDGNNVLLEVNDVVRPNDKRRVLNTGMRTKNGERGNVIFKFKVNFSSYLNN